ncbi:LacI family transcriptional regulator [Anaerobacterium chartisolvens]|uniref:LacI family transcriptional regulator n=1 Tax=Anaerobacterium chartisolvens TaxID=1297424 RepID=A0A369B3I6_9FIRM|nr:LacI family DNA-binding transcriptional regulator [Anaerobacterium chartisolvens]RCX16063.1 LacI family transcriptional regulator [Anaerobacterium chartisolvens]
MVKIEDVAALAGVSVATVSRVLNNNYMVSKEKREKVLEAVKALNYQPNALGRNLRRAESKMVLVVCTAVIDEAMRGIQDVAKDLGYDVILSYSDRTGGMNSIKFLENGLVGGVIFLNMLFKDEELINISKQYPVVQCGEYVDIPNSYLVAVNDGKATYDMTKHVIELGKKRIAFVACEGYGENPHFSRDRERGYKLALADFGLPHYPELRRSGDFSIESGIAAAKEYLKMDHKPDAVICAQDNIAFGCLNTFKNAGLSVPGDIAVTGFDNIEISEVSDPSITTIAQPFYEIGRETMKMLVSLMKGEISVGRHLFIDYQLIVRGSTVGKK